MQTTTLAATAGVPRQRLDFVYDSQSRRISKTVSNSTDGTNWAFASNLRFLYDGWNLSAEYSAPSASFTTLTLQAGHTWGTDLSTTPQGAGGVGGLLCTPLNSQPSTLNCFPSYDGNGNVSEYLAADGSVSAHFEYDPFGNTVVATGSPELFTYRFSTKPLDFETGLYYYQYRYYDPLTGRWPSRDPIEEGGGVNVYGFVGNNGVNWADRLGMEFYAAFVPAWWELNDGKTEPFQPGQGDVLDDSTTELFLRLGQRIAATSREAAQESIQELSSMTDDEWKRITSNGFSVRWVNSSREVGVTLGNLSGKEYDVELIDRTGTSRSKVIQWLRHELGSHSEIFIRGNPEAILRRVVQRGNEELSKDYEWTSFGLIMHHGRSGLNFPTGGVPLEDGRSAAGKVKARQSNLIACVANPEGVGEIVDFVAMSLQIDNKGCKAVFSLAQVVRGFSRD